MNECVKFGVAIEALKEGKRVALTEWINDNVFIFLRPACKVHINDAISTVKFLPRSVKDYFMQDVVDAPNATFPSNDPNDNIIFTEYICMKDIYGRVINGWTPSSYDILSEDWIILD